MNQEPDRHDLAEALTRSSPRRDTYAGWQRWRTTRGPFAPAPRLTLAEWRALSPAQRALHDLHRTATHVNLPLQETPMSLKVARLVNRRIRNNALKTRPSTRAGVMVTSWGYQGKTETVCEVAAAFEDAWLAMHNYVHPGAVEGTRDLHAPVAYVQTPVTAKPKSTCQSILGFFGAEARRLTLPQLIRQVADSLDDHGTKALILDDITRLRMHRADDQDTLDLIRAFMSMNVTLVLVGVDILGSGLLRQGRWDPQRRQWVLPPSQHARVHGLEATQTERRFDLVELDRFRYSTPEQIAAFHDHLAGLQANLRLLKAPADMLTGGHMPEYLMRRTDGVVGLLERLIEDGCQEAMDSGKETLDEALLDDIVLSLDDPDRDPQAGEVPAIPGSSGPAPRGPRDDSVRHRPGSRPQHHLRRPRPRNPHRQLTPMPHLPDPLPRALAPLPGEGLPGLLLRLSHRLDMSPLQVLIRAGAVKPPAASVPGQLLVTLGSRLKLFAHTTRLTADEAAALTLEPHGERFPPVTESLRIQTQHRFTWARIDPWVLSTFTRYCPKCLAGDGSVIQKRHGGPWKAEWRLAVSFICREHRTFLRHLCPTCRRPAHKFDAQAGSKLLPLMQFKELHPAQCRNPAQDQDVLDLICGARLDTPPASPRLPAASPALLHLQDRIGALLDGAGSPQTAREYFTDLRILSAIILATWPLAREFNPAPLTKAVEHHLTMHRREIDALPGERRQHTWDRPPESAIASAALLHTADQILALDQHDRDEALRSMLRSGPDPDSGKWGRTDLHLFHASLSFRSAVMQARDRRSQNLARGPSSRLGSDSYRPEHIPQWLPDHWLQYPNGDLLAPRLRHPMQRRAAAVRLIQMVSRMGVQAAARFLGIPDTWPERRAGNQRLPIALFLNDREIELLANRISDTTCTTDYRHRRISLATWTLPQTHWATIWGQVTPRPGTTPPVDSPRKHQAASEFVWSRVTGSERALAPLIPALPPQLRHRRHWGSIANCLATPRPNTHYAQLKSLLTEYADQLASTIDSNQASV